MPGVRHRKPRKPRPLEKYSGGPFRPGNQVAAGNPGPGPRYRVLTQALIAVLHETDPRYKKGRIYALVGKLIERAIEGDMDAIKFVFDRVDGKLLSVPQGESDNESKHYEFTIRLSRGGAGADELRNDEALHRPG